MDQTFYKAAREGNVGYLMSIPLNKVEETLLLESHMKNNALHVAAKLGHTLFCQKVLQLGPRSLLCQKNAKEDTPLHVAARAGHSELVNLLINYYQRPLNGVALTLDSERGTHDTVNGTGSSVETQRDIEGGEGLQPLWMMKNLEQNTALHLALKNRHADIAFRLLDLEHGLACFVNSDGESPLFLAVEANYDGVVRKILSHGSSFSFDGPNGQNPLHAAVTVKSATSANLLLGKTPELIKQTDKDGQTALHYATVLNSLTMIRFLLKRDTSAVYILDNNGLSPVLIAAHSGTASAVKAILKFCPDAIELLNRDGRNVLHLAVDSNTCTVVRGLLKRPEIQELINEADREGNNPLHLATKNHHYRMLKELTRTKSIDVNAKNKEGFTALDICESQWKLSLQQRCIWKRLTKHKASRAQRRHPHCIRRFERSHDIFAHPKADLARMANGLLIVATLLCSVTFTATFEMPGGYRSQEPHAGAAVHGKKLAFIAFVVSDAVAMCCSITVMFLLIWAVLGDPAFLFRAVGLAVTWLRYAFFGTIVAFVTGIYLVIHADALWLAILVCILGCSTPFLVSLLQNRSSLSTRYTKVSKKNRT
ncbi:hypothetical protein IFM89_007543 [Coptis chinensis]|uniref:PGG domain-containing protein n=1 Tax=Coptis chinensis TaxID=261450 RepID=A0A835I1V1_9MAGN|nr:hypothetical protein IFM89_007543 [Coptis chinensis]